MDWIKKYLCCTIQSYQFCMNNDIIIYICNYLNDKDKISFLSINRHMNLIKNKVFYHEMVCINKIQGLWYINQIKNVVIKENVNLSKYIIPNITNLTFGYNFNQCVKGYIPSQVTHLTFGQYFRQSLEGCIPPSVTHLTLPGDIEYNKKYIPSTVIYLTWENYFFALHPAFHQPSGTCNLTRLNQMLSIIKSGEEMAPDALR